MEKSLIELSEGLARAVETVGRTVVAVHGRPRISSSGVLWRSGVVLTADHTLRREEGVRVTLPNGREVRAEIAGRDPGTDIAALKIDAADFAPIAAGDDALRVGNLALVIGRSAETGIGAALAVIGGLSGPWHTWRGGKLDRLVRLDAGLYPGLSGAAVVDANGGFIGIATLGLSRTSPLCIPASTLDRVGAQLIETGHVVRGFLGVGLQPIGLPAHLKDKLAMASDAGLIVLSVEPEAPAGIAGVQIGDVFVSLDGKPVSDTSDVQALLGPEFVGKTLSASILRAGALIELPISIAERARRRS